MHKGFVLASRSSPSIKPQVVVGHVREESIEWFPVKDAVEVANTKYDVIKVSQSKRTRAFSPHAQASIAREASTNSTTFASSPAATGKRAGAVL